MLAPPTAKHFAGIGHATPLRTDRAPRTLGLAMTRHLLPSQRSTSVFGRELVAWLPTAKQLVVLEHDTPFSELMNRSFGLGVDTICHRTPFHRSISVVVIGRPD